MADLIFKDLKSLSYMWGINMKFSVKEIREKMMGCWMGKSIGGTLGAPFECRRGLNDVSFYTQTLNGESLPNDDLDLQLVWLNAVERNGKYTDASVLAEYWISFIDPNWSEYGAAKNNLREGVLPSFSGFLYNPNRNSCGAFIRSEIWSCLAPGNPNLAVKYMLEDAIVDHSEEGVYSAVFCAAVESAAFCESDISTLIEIGLSYIPEDCAVAKAINLVVDSYKNGVDWKEVRMKLLVQFPATFGLILGCTDKESETEIPKGDLGFDAPSNIGFVVLGLLYGEGEFGRSICLATNCGEDTDCTAATVGAILGIINGESNIPSKWKEPIGNRIVTRFINSSDAGCTAPKTIEELTDRIIRTIPEFLGQQYCTVCEDSGLQILCDEAKLFKQNTNYNNFYTVDFISEVEQRKFATHHSSPLLELWVDYGEPPYIQAGKSYNITVRMKNNIRQHQWLKFRCITEPDQLILPNRDFSFCLENDHGCVGKGEFSFKVVAPEKLQGERYEIILDITSKGHPTRMFVPITFYNTPVPECDKSYVK